MIPLRPRLIPLCILLTAVGCAASQPEAATAPQATPAEPERLLDAVEAEERLEASSPVAAAPDAMKPAPATPSPLAPPPPAAHPKRKHLAAPAGQAAAKQDGAGAIYERQPIQAQAEQLAPQEPHNTESYDHLVDNGFQRAAEQPLSTFSIDVDTASYSNVRRMLNEQQTVPPGAVRIEELVNYFSYNYPNPEGETPFSVTTEVAQAPWKPQHQLVRIGLQGKRIPQAELPPRNLVFLIDVSGSMAEENKLPLLTRSLSALTETLDERDHVAMVVYAGASGVVLEPTAGNQKATILEALRRLEAGGSTNGASGIELAYATAKRHYQAGGVNRVILATDGDFNVGPSSESELVQLIEQKRKTGVYLTVLGFGMGNYKDAQLEQLADHGNGNYAYIDNYEEARKVLVEEGGSTLVTIAKDVKIQVEFNPRWVGAYRLIGYENRKLENHEFQDDKKDAGEIGAGHNVTALYEIVPPAALGALPRAQALKYQKPGAVQGNGQELLTVSLRYKLPQQDNSRLLSTPVAVPKVNAAGSEDLRFAAAVAAFGMVLRQSEHRGQADLDLVDNLARGALGADVNGRRKELLELVRLARAQVPSATPSAVSVAR